MKTCTACGSSCTSQTGRWHYVECGLDNVFVNGIEIRTCSGCGKQSAVIPAVLQLHAVIAQALVLQPQRLRGAELKFLRQYLGLSREDLAQTMGTTTDEVTAWEREGNLSVHLERFLRLLAIAGKPADQYPAKGLAAIGAEQLRALGTEVQAPRREIELQRPAKSTWQKLPSGGAGLGAAYL